MTARKKAQPEPKPLTVADLLLALASYPQDATLGTRDPYIGVLVFVPAPEGVDDEHELIDWMDGGETGTAKHYQRPDIIERVIRRSEPLDDFAAAKEFLEWLATKRGYNQPQVATGGGHNEPTSYRDLSPAELAEEFARRES